MSGAVDIVRTAALPMVAPGKAATDLITKGANPLSTIGREAGRAFNTAKDKVVEPVVGGFTQGAGMNQEIPNIADPIDPNKVADEQKKERARVKRQAEIDILTDRPGRGGTILTDDYTYKV